VYGYVVASFTETLHVESVRGRDDNEAIAVEVLTDASRGLDRRWRRIGFGQGRHFQMSTEGIALMRCRVYREYKYVLQRPRTGFCVNKTGQIL
jgi:hypothetical protein